MYAAPDAQVGDQVMAALALVDGADLTPGEFGEFLVGQPGLSPKAWPRHVWIIDGLPSTATNKILKRELSSQGATPDGGVLWTRIGRMSAYTVADQAGEGRVNNHVSPG
ncbi:hypothetical protein [Candidatus Mycobacterium methanotrophicum]|uniref:hypothetical protein n=1 Tax=Candidatus Mycobacterium methanotrophicum TaxID=2943498 RepID=UPI003517DE65